MDKNELIKQIVEEERKSFRVNAESHSDEECLGIALSTSSRWDYDFLLRICYYGLEDCNFATGAELIDLLIQADDPKALARKMIDSVQTDGA